MLGNPNATFADLKDSAEKDPRFKHLHVFSHQVSGGRTFEFCARATPDVPIAQAVRASMSIPIFFVPWTFPEPLRKRYPGDFVDGGVAFNYPISAFDSGPNNYLTLGLLLEPMSYDQEGLLDVAFHAALDVLNVPQGIRTIAEALLEAFKIGPLDLDKANALTSSALAAAPQGDNDLRRVIEVLKAVAPAWVTWRQGGHIVEAITMIEKGHANSPALQDLANSSAWKESIGFLKLLARWFSTIGTLINAPTNVVFDRDAPRSIFVNTLGYTFVDFWMPDCNKRKLVDAGYNCASQYLSLFMYS